MWSNPYGKHPSSIISHSINSNNTTSRRRTLRRSLRNTDSQKNREETTSKKWPASAQLLEYKKNRLPNENSPGSNRRIQMKGLSTEPRQMSIKLLSHNKTSSKSVKNPKQSL